MIANNENNEACAKCGGLCCLNLPGCTVPEDFNLEDKTEEEVKGFLIEMFSTGMWQIDWWDFYAEDFKCEHKGYFIRPATKRNYGKLFHGAWAFEGCVFLQGNSCVLEFTERPYDCKVLVPSSDGDPTKCDWKVVGEDEHPKLHSIHAWLPYEKIIIEVAEIIQKED